MPIRRIEFDDEGHGLLQERRPGVFQWTDVNVAAGVLLFFLLAGNNPVPIQI
jgi:hypothetical protein